MGTEKLFFFADASSIHTAKWIDYFVEKKYDVHLATFSIVNITKCEKVYFLSKVSPSHKGGNYHYLFHIRELARLLLEIEPTYINAHYSYSYGFVTLLAKRYSRSNAEFSVVCHGSDVLNPPLSYITKVINRYILRQADKVFAVSDQIEDKVKSFGVPASKIFVGQYGVELGERPLKKDIDILSNRAYLPNSRIDMLLGVLEKLGNVELKVVFVLANISDSNLFNLVQRYPQFTFYKELEHDRMMELVSRSRIYLSATQSDGTSLSLLEAMSFGCVPVVSNIVSNLTWVVDDVNGYLFTSQQELLSKLKSALTLGNLNEMALLNMKIVKQNAEYQAQMNKIEAFLLS